MNKKYERYIEYIADDLEIPYFKNMKDNYGLSENEYAMVLSKIFNQPVTITELRVEKIVHNNRGNKLYYETSWGYWYKSEYDKQGNLMIYKDSDGRIVDNR